jgi:hypothetical protein
MSNLHPERRIHDPQEEYENGFFKRKIPAVLLILFILLLASVGLVYTYFTRDLPACNDEYIQIMLNEGIRNNETLIQDSRTIAFNGIVEVSHINEVRNCSTNLQTNQSNYLVGYQVINLKMDEKSIWNRLMGSTDYSVKIKYVRKADPN